ncbi:MAG: hypothetical protein ACPHWU_08150 [Marinobacter vinifirmus]
MAKRALIKAQPSALLSIKVRSRSGELVPLLYYTLARCKWV